MLTRRLQKFDRKQIIEALKDPKCWCVWACGIGYAIANAGITNFNPLIIAGYGFSQTKTVLMATPQAAVAMVAGAVLTAISHFVQNLRCFFWIISALIGLAGAVMVHTLDVTSARNASLGTETDAATLFLWYRRTRLMRTQRACTSWDSTTFRGCLC